MIVGRPRSTCMRLSYCYLDPDELAEGARRLGVAIRAMGRARAPREAAPVA
jgi:DNA-binding transcriptional MocR family regulator